MAAGAAAFGGVGALSRLARATELDPIPDHYFIFCYFSGGWDILLGLDPKDPDVFRPELNGDTFIQPAYGLLLDPTVNQEPMNSAVPGMDFGPYIGDLVNWAPRMSVVRGMSMDTLTHENGRRRFITGKPPAGLQARGSSMSSVLAACLGIHAPVPNLSAQVESFNVDQPVYASALQVNSVEDLIAVLGPSNAALPPEVSSRVAALLDEFAACETTQASSVLTTGLEQRLAAQNLVDQRIDALFDFGSNDPDMVALREQYGFTSNQLSSAGAQAAMAATAITADVSRVVSIRVASGLDSHDNWAAEQGPAQRSGFNLVATLAADLESRPFGNTGDSWLDHTTIVGFSEFSRTALLNSRLGRDHALTNACFLLGAGVKGGTVVGASSDVGMAPQAVDLATGAVSAGGVILRPEHIHRSLLHMIGVEDDIDDLRADAVGALLS
jgi:hypothetical protein